MKRLPESLSKEGHARKRVCITDYLKPALVPSFREKGDASTAFSGMEEAENRREDSSRMPAANREKGDFDIFQFLQENLGSENAEKTTSLESSKRSLERISLADFYRPQREISCICSSSSLDQPEAARRARALGLLRYHYFSSIEGGDEVKILALSSLLEEFSGNGKNEFFLAIGDVEAWGLHDHTRTAELGATTADKLERRSKYLILTFRNRGSILFTRFGEITVPKVELPSAERTGRLLFSGASMIFAMQALLDVSFTTIAPGFTVTANFSFAHAKIQEVSLDVAPFRGDSVLTADLLLFDGPIKEKWALEGETLGVKATRYAHELEDQADKCIVTLRPGLGGRLLERHVRFVATNTKNARFLFSS